MAVYESDPQQEDDSGFEPAAMEHLVPGNRGRLLDARRTPVSVVGVDPLRGSFIMRIEAFEDEGARWELGLEDLSNFQIERDARRAPSELVAELASARERFDRIVVIESDQGALASTLQGIADEQRAAAAALSALPAPETLDVYAARRRGEPQLMALLDRFLDQRGVAELDSAFARAFVSNPSAGELVKVHGMVLARLGLSSFADRVLRDPDELRAPWSWSLRRRHVIARLGFMWALWARWEIQRVTLFRAAAAEGPIEPNRPSSWTSATFSREVAEAHFEGGPRTIAAAMWRQRVPVERVFMSFLETPALNERFLEAEAILLGDRSGSSF